MTNCLTYWLIDWLTDMFRMCWWPTRLPVSPTGRAATPTSTWLSGTWSGAASCCARPASATRWTTSSPPTSASCSPTWTSRRASGSSKTSYCVNIVYCTVRRSKQRSPEFVIIPPKNKSTGCSFLYRFLAVTLLCINLAYQYLDIQLTLYKPSLPISGYTTYGIRRSELGVSFRSSLWRHNFSISVKMSLVNIPPELG